MISAWWLLVALAFGVAIGMALAAILSFSADEAPGPARPSPRPFEEDRHAGPSTVT